MRVADYIFKFLKEKYQVDTLFMVTGGGAMILNDAVGQSNIKYICCHHEQSAAMAASGYARYTGKLGVCVVTTGCGGTNTLTGVLGAFQDRIPMLIISGQSKTKECTAFAGIEFRQLGVQEVNILKIVNSITVYATTFRTVEDFKENFERLVEYAFTLHGPVWLDIPIDIQGAEFV
jgi:acetolactate synthase I/II/III large subunit